MAGLPKPRAPLIQRGHPINRGLAGAWLITEGAGTTLYDASGGRNNAALNGGATWTVGEQGPALRLDGSSGYAVAAGFNAQFANQAFAVFVEFATTSTASGVFLSGGDGFNNGWLFGVSTAGQIFFQFKPSNRIIISNTTALIDGKPHQALALVETDTANNANNTVQLILDGVVDGAAASGGSGSYGPGSGLYIGRRNGGGGSPIYLAGTIAQARVWSIGRSVADAAELCRRTYDEFRDPLRLETLTAAGAAPAPPPAAWIEPLAFGMPRRDPVEIVPY